METYNQNAFPPGFLGDDPLSLKNGNESYDIFVNEHYIGKKLVMTQNGSVNDIVDFIKKQGVNDISTELTGDHYNIKTNEEQRVQQIIDVYLQNR
ncbi:hypothetical protein [Bacillus alkalicellulosilyticus]|uniref:hypothetical protein n=1 Tax=Alkalihalobacterium alkalicellulosilyticum TaxID=1912214 RepID=UPI0009989CF5|nr:hypothetical protein [Bacillus alkalicellulosilyticus]